MCVCVSCCVLFHCVKQWWNVTISIVAHARHPHKHQGTHANWTYVCFGECATIMFWDIIVSQHDMMSFDKTNDILSQNMMVWLRCGDFYEIYGGTKKESIWMPFFVCTPLDLIEKLHVCECACMCGVHMWIHIKTYLNFAVLTALARTKSTWAITNMDVALWSHLKVWCTTISWL